MKKSVILSIGVIYILAVVFVGFLGGALKLPTSQKYVETITCTSASSGSKELFVPYATDSKEYQSGLVGEIKTNYAEGLCIVLKFDVKPDDTSYPSLSFIVDNPNVHVVPKGNQICELTFEPAPISEKIVIRSTDGKNKVIYIKLVIGYFDDI